MILPFRTKFKDGKKTNFPFKIWKGLQLGIGDYQVGFKVRFEWLEKCFENGCISKQNWNEYFGWMPSKIHTIRADKKNRWKAGNKIHFVINNRTKDYFQFAPVLECRSVQEIEIIWGKPENPLFDVRVYIDQKLFYQRIGGVSSAFRRLQMEELAQLDGFDSVEDFFKWFSTDFKGKIIHWTNFRYEGRGH